LYSISGFAEGFLIFSPDLPPDRFRISGPLTTLRSPAFRIFPIFLAIRDSPLQEQNTLDVLDYKLPHWPWRKDLGCESSPENLGEFVIETTNAECLRI
jgi:hypothetical protein